MSMLGINLSPFLDSLIEEIEKARLKPNYKEQLLFHLNKFLELFGDEWNYVQLREFVLYGFRKKMEVSPTSVKTRYRMVRGLFKRLTSVIVKKMKTDPNFTEEGRKLLKSIEELLTFLKYDVMDYEEIERDYYLPLEEIERVLKLNLDQTTRSLLISYLYLGCRRRELFGIEIITKLDKGYKITVETAKAREKWKRWKSRTFAIDERIFPYLKCVWEWSLNFKSEDDLYFAIYYKLKKIEVRVTGKEKELYTHVYPHLLRHTFVTWQRVALHELRSKNLATEITASGFAYAIGWRPREKGEPEDMIDIYSSREQLTLEEQASRIFLKYHYFKHFGLWDLT